MLYINKTAEKDTIQAILLQLLQLCLGPYTEKLRQYGFEVRVHSQGQMQRM
jgi:hypothetical protein